MSGLVQYRHVDNGVEAVWVEGDDRVVLWVGDHRGDIEIRQYHLDTEVEEREDWVEYDLAPDLAALAHDWARAHE